jgi:hypothetical protein
MAKRKNLEPAMVGAVAPASEPTPALAGIRIGRLL